MDFDLTQTFPYGLLPANSYDIFVKNITQVRTSIPEINNVIFNNPATVVYWKDGTKTVVKCQDDDKYSKQIGLAMCIIKKVCGNKGNYNDVFEKWCK